MASRHPLIEPYLQASRHPKMIVDASRSHGLCLGAPRVDGQLVSLESLALQIEARGIESALSPLTGEFALAVQLSGERMLLAVDRFAVRTLCWRLQSGQFRFAERADDLAHGHPRAGIDRQAIYDYLYFHAIPSPRTIFDGVFRLPPAHYALFDGSSVTVKPYWTPTFQEPTRGDFASLAAEFRSALRSAVSAQLDGTKPACYLSGGTDSSTVAGMIREVAERAAASYSIGFEAEGYDEMAYARLAAQRFGCEHHEYYVTPNDLVRSMPEVARHYDQPFGNSSALPAYYCAKMARDDGVTRILAGDGGDELFGGNARYAKQRLFDWYGAVPASLRSSMLEPLLLSTQLGRAPLLRKAGSYVEQARVPMPDRLEMYNLLLRIGPHRVLTPDFLEQVDADAPGVLQRTVWQRALARSNINRALAFDWRFTLAESDLPKVTGSATMAGVAVAFPFLDREVLEFSMRLPPEYKLKGLKLRWFFKEALRGFLPDEIIAKKKHGFGLPFGLWTVRNPELYSLARDSLQGLAGRGIVRPDFVRPLLEDMMPAHPGYYGEMVWILTMLEQWLQHVQPEYDAR